MTTLPPARIESAEQLEELLSDPPDWLVDRMRQMEGDIIILGAAGKMGPTLTRMAKRASDQACTPRRIIAVSRFSAPDEKEKLEACGIETIRCDLLDRSAVKRLPDAPNVVYMAGKKFGSTGAEAFTWAMNTHVPAIVGERYRASRIAVFSTGNVYGLSSVATGGSQETDPVNPVGEYAMSCVGRERIFEHMSRTHGTPMTLIRLNYAVEMRYGILVDIGERVWKGETIPLEMGYFNVIWQGDANAMALASLDYAGSPPHKLNVASREVLSVRKCAEEFGKIFERPAQLQGEEADNAILASGVRCCTELGEPRVASAQLIQWISHWIREEKPNLGKPTHFENRRGDF